MSYPVLIGSREAVALLREGQEPELETSRCHSGPEVEDRHFRILGSHLRDLKNEVHHRGVPRTVFDPPAAIHLHRDLPINRSIAADSEFWAYVSVVEFRDLVRWRWGKEDADEYPPANRFLGRWKDTFCRLWFRAELAARADGSGDPYEYVDVGGEDFWVGILERRFAECNNLIAELLPYWREKERAGTVDMEDHRRFFRVLRLLRPSRAYETLSGPECRRLFDQALSLSREDWLQDLWS